MLTIWKYRVATKTVLQIPKGGRVLSVDEQNGDIYIWVLANPNAEKEDRTFLVYGTGHDIPDNPMWFVGTVQLMGGKLVFHIFEEFK